MKRVSAGASGCPSARVCERGEVGRVEGRLVRDVEPDRHHGRSARAAEGAEDDARGLGIVPDVEFRAWRDVARLAIGAAHDDEPLEKAGKLGLAHDGERDVGQGSGRDEDEPSRMRVSGADDGVDGVSDVRGLGRLRQDRIAEAGFAMNRSRVGREVGERRRRLPARRECRSVPPAPEPRGCCGSPPRG